MRFKEFNKKTEPSIFESGPKRFTDINGETNMLDYILAVEAEISKKPLSEDIDTKLVGQIEKLSSLGVDNPEVGKKYIPAYVFYISEKQIRVHGSKSPLELLDIRDEDGVAVYNFEGRKYPDKRLSSLSYGRLFVFDNKTNFDKFMNVMSLRFNVSQLSESKKNLKEAAKVGREYQHVEDLVFIEGSKGAHEAADILDNLGSDSGDVAIKWDGNPTIFWGRDESGEFVMVGKNGWGRNKSTSPEDLANFIKQSGKGEKWREDFGNSMAATFPVLERATPIDFRGYVFGDLLYYPGRPFVPADEGHISFTPNLVKYTVSTDSKLGQRIAASTVGVVVHSKYDEFGSKSGTPVTDVKELNSEEAVVLGQTYVTHQPTVDTSETEKIRKIANTYAQTVDEFLAPRQGLSDMKQIIYTYVNQQSRTRQLDNLENGFFDWLKSSKVSANKQAKIAQMAQESPKALPAIFKLVKLIMAVKDKIIDQLDSGDAEVTASTRGEKGGEGYVAQNSKVKLVPRARWQPTKGNYDEGK